LATIKWQCRKLNYIQFSAWYRIMNDSFGEDSMSIAKRGMDRDSLFLKAVLRFPSAKDEHEVRIRNLSAGGLMAEIPTDAPRGERVEINLRSIGWVSGRIAWVTDGRVGIAFDHPINPKDARKPANAGERELPLYLKKLNTTRPAPNKLRRV
jgi:hypothetical protein